ncbi:hypothetical protein CAPTEDRAFT_209178 [Capitella teleta]|uniref:RRM domain-containing protein n=1 Tax=Capitella teleta TaxID=283909 RepID=R7TCL1_CAPTE|nr:hypothetical protein CAPTEDRAFT_209178 [Capitella teleta]|eukprot:ELT91473.1 hypothetical protein CAPTEDRAFT_209178 [Capitella teleta]
MQDVVKGTRLMHQLDLEMTLNLSRDRYEMCDAFDDYELVTAPWVGLEGGTECKPVMFCIGRGKPLLPPGSLILPVCLLSANELSANSVEGRGSGKQRSQGKGRGRGKPPRCTDITEEVYNSIAASSTIHSTSLYKSDPSFTGVPDFYDADLMAQFQRTQQQSQSAANVPMMQKSELKEDVPSEGAASFCTRTAPMAPLDIKSKEDFPTLGAKNPPTIAEIIPTPLKKPATVTIKNLPTDLEKKNFKEVLANYGEVKKLNFKVKGKLLEVHVKMAEVKDAEFMVECLNGNDIFHPGHLIKAELTSTG